MKAIVIDKDYGSVSPEELKQVQDAYKSAGIDLELCHFTTEEEIVKGCQDAFAALCTGNPPVTKKVIEALPSLKFIQRFGAGVNSIDLDAAVEAGKIVLYLPGFCAKELADLAVSMILSLIRNTAYYDREIRKGNWPKCQYLLPPDVREMTLGLYGFGAAAKHLCRIFKGGFGTNIISCDPYVSDDIKAQYPYVEFVNFEQMLEQSDIVSIHVNLTPETTHVFNREAFRKMKPGSMIINTSRGPVIDQEALVWALENGEIRYAGLDTLEQEPILQSSPLLKMDNVILNPHSGSYGAGAKKTQLGMVCSLIPAAITSGNIPLRFVANRDVTERNTGYHFISPA